MKFAVIAAGEGSRLSQEGVQLPKPLVHLNGEAMIDRLIRIFESCGATEIVIIVNEWSTQVRQHIESLQLSVPLRLVVKTTPSSMHSLHALAPLLRGGKFCLTTVDTIFREEEFIRYIRHFESIPDEVDGCMAVTPYVDDEKPLWVATDDSLHITGFHDKQVEGDRFVSGGIYCLNDRALDVLDHCMAEGMSRMRNFQRQLVADGLKLEAWPMPKIVDVDHKEDILKAEAFLQPLKGAHWVGISRDNRYSPNCTQKDAAILQETASQLQKMGAEVQLMREEEFGKENQGLLPVDGCFTMARNESTLQRLRQLEERGVMVVNSAFGISRCVRGTMTKLFERSGTPYPKSRLIEASGSIPEDIAYPCWLKRGDGCAQQMEDTCYVQNPEQAEEVLKHFWSRGVTLVVVSEHIKGDLIKFYGVRDTDFFYWFYPSDVAHSKFGLEVINGAPKGLPFSVSRLKQITDEAARVLDVPVYGGDCVVQEDGQILIIDFNDWPSFAPCCHEAGYKIAELITNLSQKRHE